MNSKNLYLGLGYGALVILLVLLADALWTRGLPNFEKIHDAEERKEAFFKYLLPHVRHANQQILKNRKQLAHLERKSRDGVLNRRDIHWLSTRSKEYGLDLDGVDRNQQQTMAELWRRMDEVPPSLALAQAALESAWGTSRFAREGNNLFGIQCNSPGCGIVPNRRPAGSIYEVAVYSSPEGCFQHYMLILNGNPDYRLFWNLRQEARHNGAPLEGLIVAGGLRSYSTERDEYIRKVRQVIRANQLEALDLK